MLLVKLGKYRFRILGIALGAHMPPNYRVWTPPVRLPFLILCSSCPPPPPSPPGDGASTETRRPRTKMGAL
jgi:hypothetical protein